MIVNDRFKDKIVLITGATSGIGRAAAKSFANEGAAVLIIGRNEERAKQAVDEINAGRPCSSEFFICDISEYDSVCKLKKIISEKYGHIDILFNNAGIFRTGSLEQLNLQDWHESFAINVDGTMNMTKSFIDIITLGGCIINNASVSGLDSFTSGSKTYMYGASKAALIKFSKLCALNYADRVRVNIICPGIIDTEIYTNRDFSRFIPGIPMGYVADVDAVTNAIMFLASKEASYITGAVLPIDGGMSLK